MGSSVSTVVLPFLRFLNLRALPLRQHPCSEILNISLITNAYFSLSTVIVITPALSINDKHGFCSRFLGIKSTSAITRAGDAENLVGFYLQFDIRMRRKSCADAIRVFIHKLENVPCSILRDDIEFNDFSNNCPTGMLVNISGKYADWAWGAMSNVMKVAIAEASRCDGELIVNLWFGRHRQEITGIVDAIQGPPI